MQPGGYDAELRRHDEHLRRACDVQPRDDGVWLDSRAWIVTAGR